MRLVSLDPYRTLGMTGVTHVKPGEWRQCRDTLRDADWVLFPPFWQLNALQYGLGCRVFPCPATYRIGHDKIEMTRAFELVLPHHLPSTHIAANTAFEADKAWELMATPFVAKRPKASGGTGV